MDQYKMQNITFKIKANYQRIKNSASNNFEFNFNLFIVFFLN